MNHAEHGRGGYEAIVVVASVSAGGRFDVAMAYGLRNTNVATTARWSDG